MKRLTFLLLLVAFVGSTPVLAADFRETFMKEFLAKPWAGEEFEFEEESSCIGCHAARPQSSEIPARWKMTVHYQNGVSCHDCHGGDPKDPSMAMSHQRGFVGVPKPADIPEFCGKCHIGILKNYLESGHGRALKASGKGPHCVTCHGSHKEQRYIERANMEIINESLCSRCHSYERARIMKQALYLVEQKLQKIDRELSALNREGVFVDDERRAFYSTQAEFRFLFHSIDVNLIKDRTDDFTARMNTLEAKILDTVRELRFRRNFSTFLLLLFGAISVLLFFSTRNPKE